MNQAELASRLRAAREAFGISQLQAAEALNLPRTAITQMEAGKRAVSTLELTQFSNLYKQPISYFLDDKVDLNEDLDKLLFREKPGLNAHDLYREKLLHYINLCKEGIILEKLLQMETRVGPPRYDQATPRNKGEAARQGEMVAEGERKRLGIGLNPIGDIAKIISAQGIWACAASLPDDMSGLFLNNSKTGVIVLVNASHVKARKRFSYAHEYAHALFDREENLRVSNKENSSEYIEVRANSFAASFLMPAEGVKEVLVSLNKGKPSRDEQVLFDVSSNASISILSRPTPFSQSISYQDLAVIAHHFGVSYHAALFRLRSLNFISEKERHTLQDHYQNGKRFLDSIGKLADIENKEDENLWDRELRSELACLTIEAYRRKEISRGRVLELGDEIGIGGKLLYEFAEASMNEKPGVPELENNKNETSGEHKAQCLTPSLKQ